MRRFATPLLALAAFLAAPLAAQTVVQVSPIPGALNAAVNAESVAEGTVFELQRGQRYLTTEQLNPLVSVTIRAAGEGDCVTTFASLDAGGFPGCALMQTGDPSGGGDTFRLFDIRDHDPITLTLEDVAMTNRTPNGVQENRTLRVRTDDTTVRGTDVVFYNEIEDVIRFDGPNASLFLDTVLGARIGSFDDDGNAVGSEGNFIDTRDSNVDTIDIQNGTFYSVNNAVVRVKLANVEQLTFRNNTVHHVLGSVLAESGDGASGDDLDGRALLRNTRIENVMVINAGYGGTDDDDALNVFAADTLDAAGTHVFRNVNVFTDPADVGGEGTGEVELATDDLDEIAEDVLTESPATLMFAEAQPAPFEGFDQQPFDYSYTGGDSRTAGTDGQPIGALVWFGLDVTPPADGRDVSVATDAELRAAIDGAQEGDVITITSDLDLTDSLEPGVGVTVRGDGDGVTLRVAFDGAVFEPAGDLTLENLTVDGQGRAEEFVRVRSEGDDDDGDDDVTLRNVVLFDNGGENDGVRFDGDAGSLRVIDSAISGVTRRPIATRDQADLDEIRIVRSTIANSADRLRLSGATDEVVIDGLTLFGVMGDGIDFDSDDIGTVTITNSILVPVDGDGNRAVDHTDSPPTFSISNTNVFPLEDAGGEDALDSAAQAAFDAGEGNLSVDPMFANAAGGDFSLPADSPLLTAGADGGQIGNPNVDVLVGTPTDGGPEAAALALRAYPNPAAGQATVAFSLDAPGDVRVEAFDVLGRRVAVLADGPFAAGEQTATFDAAALPSGVYVVRLATGDVARTVRLTVVR